MFRFFRWFRDFRRNRNHTLSSSPQPSDKARSPCNQPIVEATPSWKFDSKARWSKEYDLSICHAEDDIIYVENLVSYLELQPHSLRCFLQIRDSVPGGAMSTELCQAVRESHCWILIISPSFLKDPWCWYQMQQALSESPTANGRVIPVRKQLERKDYPQELRFMYGIDVRLDKDNGFLKIKQAILYYLEELCAKDREEQQQRDSENLVDEATPQA
ncbi:toll/interleukin-1 receptor domain-containing adapter protein [Narcine bancroftii]|uniref:toll/interleukin-1 receptor domain-containing adapter protein n=1 Tax=Narcine bancroftii TaxID=1343680 RepID=UPI00383225CF